MAIALNHVRFRLRLSIVIDRVRFTPVHTVTRRSQREEGRRTTRIIALSRLTGVPRIEAVFRTHVGDDCEVLAASGETNDG